MLTFVEHIIVAEIQKLHPLLRVTFAVACAERQFPALRRFHAPTWTGDSQFLGDVMERIWESVIDGHLDKTEFESMIDRCMGMIPEDQAIQPWSEDAIDAQNAAMALVYALRTALTGDAQEAAWSARVAFEALDNRAIIQNGIDINRPGSEDRALRHPAVQAELRRQRRDLDELGRVVGEDRREITTRIRDRARAESSSFFNAAS